MYAEATSYIDAITHAVSYYTDAQADAIFFGSGSDGAGSGLVAATLDGYTAEQIMAAGSPTGVICWWSGSEGSIPSGWYLCNGLNGTPDLRNRFVVGAGSHYTKAESGGSNTVTTTASITVAGHALTADEMPLHTHTGITDYYAVAAQINWTAQFSGTGGVTAPTDHASNTDYAGSGDPHTHTASFSGTSGQDKICPFYAICFIMKG